MLTPSKMRILRCMGSNILCEISKGTFEILHKILNPYSAKYEFYWLQLLCVTCDIYELWRYTYQWDGS